MTVRIEDANDLAVDLDGVRNPDCPRQGAVDALGDGGLSGAGQVRLETVTFAS